MLSNKNLEMYNEAFVIHHGEFREFDQLCCMSSTPLGLEYFSGHFDLSM